MMKNSCSLFKKKALENLILLKLIMFDHHKIFEINLILPSYVTSPVKWNLIYFAPIFFLTLCQTLWLQYFQVTWAYIIYILIIFLE